jgi:hypothetical protein
MADNLIFLHRLESRQQTGDADRNLSMRLWERAGA